MESSSSPPTKPSAPSESVTARANTGRKVGRPKREETQSLQEQIEAKQRAAATLLAEAKRLVHEQHTRAAAVLGDLMLEAMQKDGKARALVVSLLRDAKLSPRDRASVVHLML